MIDFWRIMGTSLADSVPDCYKFIFEELVPTWINLYTAVKQDWSALLLSFLFTWMSRSKKLQDNITNIEENNNNQSFPQAFYQYGQIIN